MGRGGADHGREDTHVCIVGDEWWGQHIRAIITIDALPASGNTKRKGGGEHTSIARSRWTAKINAATSRLVVKHSVARFSRPEGRIAPQSLYSPDPLMLAVSASISPRPRTVLAAADPG